MTQIKFTILKEYMHISNNFRHHIRKTDLSLKIQDNTGLVLKVSFEYAYMNILIIVLSFSHSKDDWDG